MQNYLLRWKFSNASTKHLIENPQDRTNAATSLVESFGGKIDQYFLSLGECDGVLICQLPEAQNAMAAALLARSSGAFETLEVTPLFTGKEAQSAMNLAKTTNARYQPPNG